MKGCFHRAASGATLSLLDLVEAEARIPAELGVRLSSVFMYDRLVFVEGPHDEDILREYASKLGINLSQVNAGFLPMRGARNFAHFASSATLSFLSKRQVRIWFVTDRDERDDSEIAKLKHLVGPNAIVCVLKKREMENYLACPRALAQFIGVKRELSGPPKGRSAPSEAEVGTAIDQCVEELRHAAIERRVAKILCRPLYPALDRVCDRSGGNTIVERVSQEVDTMIQQLEQTKESAGRVFEEQAGLVETRWASSKLSIVPGDELLDMVCQKFGVRFKKESGDGARLVGLMQASEIDPEITDLIKQLGSA